MESKNRRKFIKSLATGVAGFSILPTFATPTIKEQLVYLDNSSADATEVFWENIKRQFMFANRLRYFNNASLGSSPNSIQQATRKFRETLDSFPSKYMWGGWNDEKEGTRTAIAELFSVSSEEIAIIHNTTEGMNLIARSFDLSQGDEIILADHEHASGTIPWEVWQETKGVKLIRPKLPILPKSIDEIVAVYRNAITDKTKIISMCHIVNTNGMILPVKEISEMAHKKGVLVAVDGAQSAGMFQINLNELTCDFYTASAHKWLFSPKGVGILYAKKESQHHLKPLMVARGHKDRSIRRLENYNTRNLPEVLALGACIKFHKAIGDKKIHNRSYELKSYFCSKIATNSKLKLKTPSDHNLSCAIQIVEVLGKDVKQVKKLLFESYGIDCRPMTSFGLNALRFSFAIYITKKDIDFLIKALEEISKA